MKNVYIRQLNKEDFTKIKDACIIALNELEQIEELENALDGRVYDLIDLIDIENILNKDNE